MSLSYNAEQDRLLLRVGLSDDTELLVWLTYRITRQMWQLLNVETNLPNTQATQGAVSPAVAVEQFRKETQALEELKKLDFSTKYKPRNAVRNDGIVLAVSLKVSDNDGVKHLNVTCLDGVSANMNLPQSLILALCNMLQVIARKANWDLGWQLSLPPLANVDESKVLH